MAGLSVDSRPYFELLEDFLQQMKKAIDEQSHQGMITFTGSDDWERYSLELNTFYYQNFKDRFLQRFSQQVEHSIRDVYGANQNANSLKQNLAANLKQWALLFNQLQHLQRLAREELVALQSPLPRQTSSEAPAVEMIYILKDLARHFTNFLERQRNRQIILDDRQFTDALLRYPEQRTVGNLMGQWAPDNPKAIRELNQLLSAWQLVLKQLDKMPAKDAISRESVRSLLKDLHKADLVWTDRKAPPMFRSWYKLNIQPIFQFHLASLELFGERNDRKRVIQSAVALGGWLKSLLYVLEQTIVYSDRGWGYLISINLHSLAQINPELLSEQIIETTRIVSLLSELVVSLAPAAADFTLHSQRAAAVISDSLGYWQKQSQNIGTSGSILLNEAEWLVRQLQLAITQILILDEREASRVVINQQLDFLRQTLNSQSQCLSKLQDNLKQELDPTALHQKYPNYTIEIKQVPISQGAQFPTEFSFLLDQGAVTTAASDSSEGCIIYTEGDLFFINVDGCREQAIPKIILAGKEG